MKIKRMLPGIVVLLLATVSALASSLFTGKPIYVKAVLSPVTPVVCVNAKNTCDDVSLLACRVEMIVYSGNNTTAATYENSNCTIPLQSESVEITQSPVAVYRLF